MTTSEQPEQIEQAKETERSATRCLFLDKIGALGAFVAAAAAPCCFPLLATAGAALGLGAFQSLRGYVDYTIQVMVALACFGNILAFRQHRVWGPLLLGIIATGFVFFAYYGSYHVALVYAGLATLAIVAIWNLIAKRRCAACARQVKL